MLKKNAVKLGFMGVLCAVGLVVGVGEARADQTVVEVDGQMDSIKGEDSRGSYVDLQSGDIILGDVLVDNEYARISVEDIKDEIEPSGNIRNLRVSNQSSIIDSTHIYEKNFVFTEGADLLMKGSNLELVEGKWQIKYATTTNGGSVELEVPEEVKHSGNYKWMYLSEDTKVIIKNHGSQYDVFNFTYYTAKDIEYSTSSDYYAEAGNNLFMKNVSFNKKTGIYVCLATDSYGRATGIAAAYEVQVCSDLKLKPVKDKHEYCLGDKVVLAVELYTSQSLNDAYYTWYFEGEEIYSSDEYIDYVIDGITSKQFGRYTLVVDDGIGSQVLDITVSRSASDIRPVLKPVTTIKTISRTDTKVKIQWNSSSNNAGITTRYGVFVHNGSKWVLLGKTTKTSRTITGLKPGKAYKIAVRPYAFFRVENVWASTYKAITIYTVPSNSEVFIHHKIAKTSVTAKWSKAAGATGYIVYKKVGTKWVKQGVTTKQYYTYKGLKRNTKYTFAVRPYTKIGNKVVTSKNPTILILKTAR